ncbi:MAG: 50S ribosomal protein L3, partial [Candidatus Pacearchaeota archaeon]|nr:50S ribosomal protein L3 [Candidatus Pacearchaeota archaeon]
KQRKSTNGKQCRHIREFRTGGSEQTPGDEVSVSIFTEGEMVQVSGTSKGKGYQGGVKRHGFSGKNASHGVKHEHRTLGSVGSAFPQRVIKGRKMPGHMGADRVTVKNLKVMKIDEKGNVLAVKGAVPGPRGTLLQVVSKR